jgi:hypothetical protein
MNKMVFLLEHDIKVTKSHQNLLPTQSVIVAHTVETVIVFYFILCQISILYVINLNPGKRKNRPDAGKCCYWKHKSNNRNNNYSGLRNVLFKTTSKCKLTI